MGRVKDNAEFIRDMQTLSQKELLKARRKVAKDNLERIKKEKPYLEFTPEREEEYIQSFLRNQDLWLN